MYLELPGSQHASTGRPSRSDVGLLLISLPPFLLLSEQVRKYSEGHDLLLDNGVGGAGTDPLLGDGVGGDFMSSLDGEWRSFDLPSSASASCCPLVAFTGC